MIGILLPALETVRRGIGAWRSDFTTMFEDYVAGALLLTGAWAARRGSRWGALLLVVAWSYVTGMMSSSFWYQLEETVRGTVTEDPIVLAVKFLLWGTCLLGSGAGDGTGRMGGLSTPITSGNRVDANTARARYRAD